MDETKKRLEALGATSQQVHDSIKALGLKGVKKNPCLCPVSQVARGQDPEQQCVVDRDDVVLWGTVSGSFKTPQGCSLFIVNFDSGMYPELEAELSEFLK